MIRRKHKAGWSQGIYNTINKHKYVSDHAPVYRSSWEHRFCSWCDHNKQVIKWGSECVNIPYTWQGKTHIYHTDFFVLLTDKNNEVRKFIVEIKPHGQGPFKNKKGQISKPQPPKNRTAKALKRYIYEIQQWEKNAAKWAAAQSYCAQHKLEFVILSKEDLL